ncbi:MAG: NAD(P)H-hydrate dehydratase [Rhodobacteraceae bacterium]|nr:NAD(P)H-hydrate dehydratase [Paracoccaceae bacterium]
MTSIFTAAQMTHLESIHVAAGKNTWTGLMDRAAIAVVDALRERFADGLPERAHVLCGPGNNGGDGYGIASSLHDLNLAVHLWHYGSADACSESARIMQGRWKKRGPVKPLASLEAGTVSPGDLVIDAVFGIGLNKPIADDLHGILMALPTDCHRVAVDILSGINADTGAYLGPGGRESPRPFHLTITFEGMKPGHVLGVGAVLSGSVQTVSIGLEEECATILKSGDLSLRLLNDAALPWQQHLFKNPLNHKYDHGHVLVLAGGGPTPSCGQGGAARLAAGAALRVGAGLVTLGAHHAALADHAVRRNALMLVPISNEDDLAAFLADDRINAVVAGPGFGRGRRTRTLVQKLLSLNRKAVLDADALTSFAGRPQELTGQLNGEIVLTPHEGEFRRIFPGYLEEADSRNGAVQSAAETSRATVVLKGQDTLIASPGRTASVAFPRNRMRSAWLATAGSGDVLAGLVGGFMARGADAHTAACMAVQIHHDAAAVFGPGLTADDLDGALAKAIADRCRM